MAGQPALGLGCGWLGLMFMVWQVESDDGRESMLGKVGAMKENEEGLKITLFH